MLVVDSHITPEYWGPFYNQICKCFKNGEYTKVEGQPLFRIPWKRKTFYVLGKWRGNSVEVMGWIFLEQKPGWLAWEVVQSFIFGRYRGKGWGKVLYNGVVNDGLMLASGYCHSRTSRNIWKSLVKRNKHCIWAHDFKNIDQWAPVICDPENDELWSTLQLYDHTKAARDVRLIAIRKN